MEVQTTASEEREHIFSSKTLQLVEQRTQSKHETPFKTLECRETLTLNTIEKQNSMQNCQKNSPSFLQKLPIFRR